MLRGHHTHMNCPSYKPITYQIELNNLFNSVMFNVRVNLPIIEFKNKNII